LCSTEIQWKAGKNLTVRTVKKKQRQKGILFVFSVSGSGLACRTGYHGLSLTSMTWIPIPPPFPSTHTHTHSLTRTYMYIYVLSNFACLVGRR
jgi:hypothetical protein